MTQNKDLKRVVRARMKKTGESYTSARAQILKKPAAKPDYSKLAGMSDASIKQGTGCGWERWVKTLDHYGADKMSHREIAKLIKEKFKTPSWWTQSVTVGYERIKGLRIRGQQRDGSFGMTKSRTFNVPVDVLFDAWHNAAKRSLWLGDAKTRVRTATKPKSVRLDWNGSIVAVGFFPKGEGKSSVALEQTKLPSRSVADQQKKYWSERLDALDDVI